MMEVFGMDSLLILGIVNLLEQHLEMVWINLQP